MGAGAGDSALCITIHIHIDCAVFCPERCITKIRVLIDFDIRPAVQCDNTAADIGKYTISIYFHHRISIHCDGRTHGIHTHITGGIEAGGTVEIESLAADSPKIIFLHIYIAIDDNVCITCSIDADAGPFLLVVHIGSGDIQVSVDRQPGRGGCIIAGCMNAFPPIAAGSSYLQSFAVISASPPLTLIAMLLPCSLEMPEERARVWPSSLIFTL